MRRILDDITDWFAHMYGSHREFRESQQWSSQLLLRDECGNEQQEHLDRIQQVLRELRQLAELFVRKYDRIVLELDEDEDLM